MEITYQNNKHEFDFEVPFAFAVKRMRELQIEFFNAKKSKTGFRKDLVKYAIIAEQKVDFFIQVMETGTIPVKLIAKAHHELTVAKGKPEHAPDFNEMNAWLEEYFGIYKPKP